MADNLYIGGAAQIKAYRILQVAVADIVKDASLGSVSEWLMLCHIYYNDNVIAKDLAALLEVEASLVTRLVANLTEADLVVAMPHPTDKRTKYLTATPKAAVLIPMVENRVAQQLDRLLEGVKTPELEAYRRVLDTIIINGSKS